MEKGKWIFLVNKLPTEVSPPAMSIHYAVPWPMELPKEWEKKFEKQARELRYVLSECELVDKELLDDTEDKDLWDFLNNNEVYDFVSNEDNSLLDKISGEISFWDINPEVDRKQNAMQIKFAGENIRVFPEEFSEVSLDNMKEYLKIFTFHETDLWDGLGKKPTDPDEKFIYEAALLDGCDKYQATNIVNVGDINSVDDYPPPLGWYECPLQYGLYFGKSEDDMKPRYKSEKKESFEKLITHEYNLTNVKHEIEKIHSLYDAGIKDIKPSFNYVIEIDSFHNKKSPYKEDDYYVAKKLSSAKDCAIELGEKIEGVVIIYKVIHCNDGTYRCQTKFIYDYLDKQLNEDSDFGSGMHVAWRTRGDLIGVL